MSLKHCRGCVVNSKQTMIFNQEGKVLIKVLRQEKGYRTRKFKFPNRNWPVSFLNELLKKIDCTMNEAAALAN